MITLSTYEHELLRVRKHWFFFFWPLFWTIITWFFLSPWLIYRIIIYCTDEFIITDKKFHFSHGIISKAVDSIPLDKVNEIHYDQGIFGRMLGYGTVYLQSGAMSQGNGFSYIINPDRVKGVIESALEHKQDNRDRRLADYIGDAIKR